MENVLKIGLISIMALVLSFSSIQAQTNDTIIQKIVGNLHSLAENKAQDIIYVQTSKGIYETEEDLWFKAYVIDAQYLSPSSRSKTLYVQLSHEEDNRVYWQEKYEIIDGYVDGHLFLNDSLPIGDYQLATYTSHSLFRESEEFNAIRNIKVVEKVENRKAFSLSPSTEKEKIIDLMLFPEGGNLITGLKCKLAFKAVNENGKHVEISGSLFENDIPVLEFKSLHAGMGSMDFVPNADKEYHIKLNEADSIYYLPEIQRKGISLFMTAIDSTFMSFHISQSPEYRTQKIYIRVQIRGITYSVAEGILKKSLNIKIPLKELPQGISEVTLFDEKFRPVAERLVYVNHHKKLNIKASLSDGNEYTSEDKVTLNLKVTDGQGRPVIAHLGVSIHDWIYNNDQDAKNIMTHCYLSTQIKGRIHDPGYYFNKEKKQRSEALDHLLLTQGWRRYVWSEANLNKLPVNGIPVVLDGIDGEVINNGKYDSDILGQSVMLVYNPVDETQKDIVLLDSLGRFTLAPEHLKIGERGYVYLRMMASKKPKLHISLHDFGFKHIDEVKKSMSWVYPSPPLNGTSEGTSEPFRSAPDLVQLEEVAIKSRKWTVIREKYLGKLDSIAKMETSDYVCKHNILNCELHVNDKYNFKPVEGKIYLYIEYWDGNKWVPGHPRTSGEQFRNPPLPPYRYPKLTDEYLMQKFNIVRSKGYYGHREFYQPNYDTEDSNFLDYRNTLLWDPEVITDINGNATLSFFCSDLNTLYLGTVEGLSGDGLLGIENFEFTVREGQ